jgi:TonB-dependent receptor
MNKRFLLLYLIVFFASGLFASGTISGIVKDAETGESIIGCNILLQGTSLGNVTDLDGKFEIKNVPNGTYNIVFSFISYEKFISKVLVKDANVFLEVNLKSGTNEIKEVAVTASKRTDTDLSLIISSKLSMLSVNGITSQQISRSQDKDASEVIRRIPGVSIRDGKFVIVRGLTERYNSVWLNGSSTPSSESDVRAFSFDVIPSGQIDNILIYKTPAPELPADFAGAMINIKSKNLIDRNSISFSYAYGYHQGTTNLPFYTYQGSTTDWMGFDNSNRVLPAGLPLTSEIKELFNQTNAEKTDQINLITKSFSTNMTPYQSVAKPDVDFQISFNSRFRLGDISVGNISAFGYNVTNTNENSFRAAYLAYPDTSYKYFQRSFSTRTRVSALSNWNFIFGNNQKIEFRNIFNNYGMLKTILKEGFDFYRYTNERAYELGYESRLTYSGQLAGNHTFKNDKIKFDWLLGYSYANKNQPDIRRVKVNAFDTDPESQFMLLNSTQVVPDALGRIFLKNEENIVNLALNYSQKFNLFSIKPEVKAGLYLENKSRIFTSRIFGYSMSPVSRLYYFPVESYNKDVAFTDTMFSSIKNFFLKNLDYKNGLVINEATQAADSYNAENKLIAGYLSVNIPVAEWFNVYAGLRAEKNTLKLNGYKRDGTDNNPIETVIDSLNIFPSVNATVNIAENLMLRFAGGKTVNRPEFREVSPFVFYNFEDNVNIYGNPEVKNSYVQNYDFRTEWYPTPEEIVSFGLFYKDFKDPIESRILYTGSGWNYTFENAEHAISYGLEIDVRKRLHEFEKISGLKFLSNLTLVINASLIGSRISTDSIVEGESQRPLQGQSPYIINLGCYYQDFKNRIMASIMYNKTGERISTVGDVNSPHIWEMPFNSLDFTIEKGITKWVNVKFGVKNLLNDYVTFQQEQTYKEGDIEKSRIQINNRFRPGRQFKLGISVNL